MPDPNAEQDLRLEPCGGLPGSDSVSAQIGARPWIAPTDAEVRGPVVRAAARSLLLARPSVQDGGLRKVSERLSADG
jgi:hypothetical protein